MILMGRHFQVMEGLGRVASEVSRAIGVISVSTFLREVSIKSLISVIYLDLCLVEGVEVVEEGVEGQVDHGHQRGDDQQVAVDDDEQPGDQGAEEAAAAGGRAGAAGARDRIGAHGRSLP